MRSVLKAGVAVLGGLGVLGHALNLRALRNGVPPETTNCGVVVLGYPSRRDGSPSLVQRRRVDAAVRVFREHHGAVLVMSGGAVRNDIPEADTMVRLARELGVDEAALRAESKSRNTWENVEESSAFVEGCTTVVIVSEPMHAARARRYWLAQHGAERDRVFVGRWPASSWWLSTPAALYELAIAIKDRIRFGV